MSDKKFELVDRATERKSQLPVRNGTIGPSVLDISSIHKDLGVFTYDPGFGMTAATESRITYIDGDAGVLLYRGYRSSSSPSTAPSWRWRTCSCSVSCRRRSSSRSSTATSVITR